MSLFLKLLCAMLGISYSRTSVCIYHVRLKKISTLHVWACRLLAHINNMSNCLQRNFYANNGAHQNAWSGTFRLELRCRQPPKANVSHYHRTAKSIQRIPRVASTSQIKPHPCPDGNLHCTKCHDLRTWFKNIQLQHFKQKKEHEHF